MRSLGKLHGTGLRNGEGRPPSEGTQRGSAPIKARRAAKGSQHFGWAAGGVPTGAPRGFLPWTQRTWHITRTHQAPVPGLDTRRAVPDGVSGLGDALLDPLQSPFCAQGRRSGHFCSRGTACRKGAGHRRPGLRDLFVSASSSKLCPRCACATGEKHLLLPSLNLRLLKEVRRERCEYLPRQKLMLRKKKKNTEKERIWRAELSASRGRASPGGGATSTGVLERSHLASIQD